MRRQIGGGSPGNSGRADMPDNDSHSQSLWSNGTRWIGRPRRRVEDARLLAGSGRFAGDVVPAGCLHIAFLRSPYARASIGAIDVSEANAAPGVVAVFTGDDVAELGELTVNPLVDTLRVPRFSVLAREVVMAVGEPVVAVVADSVAAAVDAVDLIDVGYDPETPLVVATGDPDEPELFEGLPGNEAVAQVWRNGNTDEAFAKASAVVEVELRHSRLAPFSLEPRAIVADYDNETGAMTIWLSTQTPHRARTDLAKIARIDKERLRVIARDVGGAFGMKASVFPEDAFVVWVADKLRRPVRWAATRAEEMLAATHGRGAVMVGELALAADGKILGLRANIAAPLGHWLPYSGAVPVRNASRILPGPYFVDAVEIKANARVSNTAAVGIYRGAGRPEAALLMERLMDEAARKLDLDPLALRRRNLIGRDRFPYRTPTGMSLDSGDYAALLERAAVLADYDGLRAEQARRRAAGELVGLGLALYIEPSGLGWESAGVRLERDGTVTATTGASAQGQGRETAYAQIVADALSISPEDVRVLHGDTEVTPDGVGALASRSTPIGGSALLIAGEEISDQGRQVAAALLQCKPRDVLPCKGGFAHRERKGAWVDWLSIAQSAGSGGERGDGPALEVSTIFETPSEAWGAGACIAAVAIDRETGTLSIERFVWIDDAGRVINPMLVDGQLTGGIAQGLGEVLMERIVYDDDGQLLTGSLMDYAVPRANDMPEIEFDRIVTPSPLNPLGAKGVGEAGTIGTPPAILNAALDALRPLGVSRLDMPLTSARIWQAMRDAAGPEREPE